MPRIIIPPVIAEVDGARVHILEITENEWVDGKKHFIVTVFVEWNGYRSGVFDLDVTSNAELLAKLRVEIAKMKLQVMMGYDKLYSKT